MTVGYYAILGICVLIMAVSAWYLGHEEGRVRNFARVGLVLGGTGAFVATIYFGAILIAVLLICIPIALVAAWWSGLWS